MERNYKVKLNPQTLVAKTGPYTITPEIDVRERYDDITVWKSAFVNDWSDIKLACKTIKEKSGEVTDSPAKLRSVKSLAYEWAAHNVLYRFGNNKTKAKCIDVNFTNDDKLTVKIAYWALTMIHHLLYGWV